MQAVLRRRGPWLEAVAWGVSAIGVLSFAHVAWLAWLRDGGAGYDVSAYLVAGRRLVEGAPLYPPMHLGDADAYRYPPTFALLTAPLAPLPELAVTWAYRAMCLVCVRVLVGSWRAVGWALLLPPLQIELIALNVTLPIAAVARLSLRGPRTKIGAALVPMTAALKYGTALLVPYLWITRPELRRPIILGAVGLAVAFAVHAGLDPATWADYLRSLGQQARSPNDAPFIGDQLLFVVPSTLGDFLVRFGVGAALVGLALVWRADWLAFTAAALAVPTLWVARLAALVAVPRLWLEERASAQEAPLTRVAPHERGAHHPARQPVEG